MTSSSIEIRAAGVVRPATSLLLAGGVLLAAASSTAASSKAAPLAASIGTPAVRASSPAAAPGTAAPGAAAPGTTAPAGCFRSGPGAPVDPSVVTMTPSGRAPGASGRLRLRLASSATGLALATDGSYRYEVRVEVQGLRGRPGIHHVAWAATPELDRHVRLGALGEDGSASGEVSWNKFLVFVTAEARPAPEAWSQRILLSATSPSGRMHTMAGHGPFSGEPCLDPRP